MSKKRKKNGKGRAKNGSNGGAGRGRTKGAQAAAPKSPPNLTARAWVTVGALVVVQGVVWAAREFALPTGTRKLNRPVTELPYQLGEFTGEDTEVDPHVFQFLDTDRSVSRLYERPDGGAVLVHVAVWDGADNWMPHPPDGCYPSGGWSGVSAESVDLATDPPVHAAHRVFEQSGQQANVLFWYRLGPITYHDKEVSRNVRRQLLSERQWPPVVKVLLQTGPGAENERMLKEFAIRVDEWTREL